MVPELCTFGSRRLNSVRLRFHAMGSAVLRRECLVATSQGSYKDVKTSICPVGQTTIQGTLDEPIAFRPKPPIVPSFAMTIGCRDRSRNISWELRNLKYEQVVYGTALYNLSSQEVDLNAGFYGRLQFSAENRANEYREALTIEGPEASAYSGVLGKQFAFQSSREHGFETIQVTTNATFNPVTNALDMSQSWVCYEESQGNP